MIKPTIGEVTSLLKSLSSVPAGSPNGKVLYFNGNKIDLKSTLTAFLASAGIEIPRGAVGLMLKPYLGKTLDTLCDENGTAKIQAIIDKFTA